MASPLAPKYGSMEAPRQHQQQQQQSLLRCPSTSSSLAAWQFLTKKTDVGALSVSDRHAMSARNWQHMMSATKLAKLGKHLKTANSDGTPSTKPFGTNPMQMKSSDSARVEASILQNLINNGFKGLTPCSPSCSTTSHMIKKVTSHTHELSAKYAQQKPTPTVPVSPSEEILLTTLATAALKQAPSKLSN